MSEETKLLLLIGEYFDLGYAEGVEGRDADTMAGDAQRVLSEIQEEIFASNTLIEEQAARIEELEQKLRSAIIDTLAVTDTNAELAGRLIASQARLSEAVKVLEPFAKYLDEHPFDLDNNGNMLPDDAQPGWTYLNAGQFRAAKDFIATLGENKNET